jgi:hypothetical protein
MTDSLDLNEIAKRPVRYWNSDGLVEIFLGLMMIVPAALFSLARLLPKASPLVFVAPLTWILVILVLKRGLMRLKERLTIPRGGYVKLPEPARAVRILTIAVFVLLGIASSLLPQVPAWWGSIRGWAFGLLFSASCVAGWVQSRDAHWLALAGLPLVVGLFAYRTGFSGSQTLLLLLITQGTGLVVSGLRRLRRFLKVNPANRLDA